MKNTIKSALDDIRDAGQMLAINYGSHDADELEILEELACDGYVHLRNAVKMLTAAGREADLKRAFWAGYRDGSN
mgnify:FL=1